MAQHLYFARDTKVYVKIGTAVWQIPVLDGFSFAQATNASEIVLSEMESAGGISRRGKRVFNDSLAPAEWSFSTYSRPFMSAAGGGTDADGAARTHAVEEVMWALLAGQAYYDAVTYDFKDESGGTPYFTWSNDGGTNDKLTIDWGSSSKSTLGTASIIFAVGKTGTKWYEITEAACNEATIDFDIDGIAMINWSGMGAVMQETTEPTVTINEGMRATNNFIRNRLTQLSIAPNKTADETGAYTVAQEALMEDTYDITLTGGNITISNNLSYITPEELGFVNYPIGHVTGNRSFSGNFTCYLAFADTGSDDSADFWQDMAALTDVVTHDFALTFAIGGLTGNPRVEVTMPSSHVEIPTHSIEDVISLDTNFTGLGSTIDSADEATVSYVTTLVPNA